MDPIERRVFMQGATIGALAFTVGGVETLLTPRQAHAQGVPLRTFKPEEAKTIQAVGEALVPGAREAGIVEFSTIMGNSAGESVTTSYGQTHEIANLWIAGPGIFPTSGAPNPTYTIFALSLRGAGHLAGNWSAVAG